MSSQELDNLFGGTATLTGEEKEVYLANLERGLAKLSSVLDSKTGVDGSITDFVNKITSGVDLFRYRTGQQDPRDNTGIYKELGVYKKFGFPKVDEFVRLSALVGSAEEKLTKLKRKDEYASEAIRVLIEYPAGEEAKRILRENADQIREINFLGRIQQHDFAYLPSGIGSKEINYDLIGEDEKVEKFRAFCAGWNMAGGFFSIYALHLDDDKSKRFLRGEHPGHVFREDDDSLWEGSDEVKEIFKGIGFGQHPRFYFDAFNQLEGIHPKKVISLSFERYETKHSSEHTC